MLYLYLFTFWLAVDLAFRYGDRVLFTNNRASRPLPSQVDGVAEAIYGGRLELLPLRYKEASL